MECSFCRNESIVLIRYNGTHLCESHFVKYFQRRVNLEFRNEIKVRGPTKIGVAISGGKDSSVALFETSRVFARRKDVELVAITIDEGIKAYRPKTLIAADKLTEKLGIEHRSIKIEDRYGTSMDYISRNGSLAPCSYCGVFRRKQLNDFGVEEGLDYMVTGLNLDDTAQSVLMNFVRGDLERLSRIGPHKVSKDGLVPRLQPLRRIPEKEVLLYAIIQGIEFSHEVCPYAERALRNEFRESIDAWEERTPGTKFAILNSFDKIRTYMPADTREKIGKCRICGSPTPGDVCKSCALEIELKA